MIVGMVAVVLVLMSGAAIGEDYYVSPDGNDNNDGNDPNYPWETVVRAVTTAGPGDTVYFREGKYPTVKSATDATIVCMGCMAGTYFSTEADANNRITFKGYRDANGVLEEAIITCMKDTNSSNWTQVGSTEIYWTGLTQQVSPLKGVGRVPNCSEDGVPLKLATTYYNYSNLYGEVIHPENVAVDSNNGYTVRKEGAFCEYDFNEGDICQIGNVGSGANVGFYTIYSKPNCNEIVLDPDGNNPGDTNGAEDVNILIERCVDVNNITTILTERGQWARNVHEGNGGRLYVRSSDGNNPGTHDTAFSEFIHGGGATIAIGLTNWSDVNGQNYLTFEDLTIEGGYYPMDIWTDHIEIKGCVIRNCYGDGIKAVAGTPGNCNGTDDPNCWSSDFGVIEDCNIYHFGESGIDVTGGGLLDSTE
jgi:hypothetical protein